MPDRLLRVSGSMTADEDLDALEVLGVLADPQRRRILVRLAAGAVCTCNDLVAETGVAQPTVSHHLKVLREAGLVVGERCGRFVNYRLATERLRELGETITALAAERTPSP